jgi:hypothetical protein
MGIHRSRAYFTPIASDRLSVMHYPTSSTCPSVDPVLVVVAASESMEINQPLLCSGNEIGKVGGDAKVTQSEAGVDMQG